MRVAAAGAPRQRAPAPPRRAHPPPPARAGAGAARRERAHPSAPKGLAPACAACAPQLLLGARVRLNLRGEDRVVVGNGASGAARSGRTRFARARRRAVPVGERRRRVRRRRAGGVAGGSPGGLKGLGFTDVRRAEVRRQRRNACSAARPSARRRVAAIRCCSRYDAATILLVQFLFFEPGTPAPRPAGRAPGPPERDWDPPPRTARVSARLRAPRFASPRSRRA